jgi:serine/threonine-protein kinase TTK/MPS1
LKPGNFLVVKGQLKLIDFGIASSLRPEATKVTRLGKAGTYNFISPEAVSEVNYNEEEGPAIKVHF